VEELVDVDVGGHVFGLLAIAGDAVEHEEIDLGFKDVGFDAVFDVGLPELDGEVIGHELAAAGVFDEFLAEGCAGVEGAKDIATGEVMEAGDMAEDLTLGAFAAAGGTEDEEGLKGSVFGVGGHDGEEFIMRRGCHNSWSGGFSVGWRGWLAYAMGEQDGSR